MLPTHNSLLRRSPPSLRKSNGVLSRVDFPDRFYSLTGMTGTFNQTVQAEVDGASTAPIGGATSAPASGATSSPPAATNSKPT